MQTHYEVTTLAGLFLLPAMQIALGHAAEGDYEQAIAQIEEYFRDQPLYEVSEVRREEHAHLYLYALARTAQWRLEQGKHELAMRVIDRCVQIARFLWGDTYETTLVMRSFDLLICAYSLQRPNRTRLDDAGWLAAAGQRLAKEINDQVAVENPLRAELLERVAQALQEAGRGDLAEEILLPLLHDYWVWEEESTYLANNVRQTLVDIWLREGEVDAYRRLANCQIEILADIFGEDDLSVITRLRKLALISEENEWDQTSQNCALWRQIWNRCNDWKERYCKDFSIQSKRRQQIDEICAQAEEKLSEELGRRVDKH